MPCIRFHDNPCQNKSRRTCAWVLSEDDGELPFRGGALLSGELDVGRHTVRRALAILEKEGVLDRQGHGRSRSINTLGAAAAAQRPLRLIVRRVVRWVDAVREGRADRRIINIAAEFVPGGSIGPAWGAKAGGACGA